MPLKPVFASLRRVPVSGWAVLNLALLFALAALLAHWTWRLAAPVPTPPAQAARANLSLGTELETLRAARLFGTAAAEPGAAVEQVTSLNLKLRGVFAAQGEHPAAAIVNVDGQDQPVVAGSEILPGVTLDAVAPDHVVLLNRGVRERLDLDAVGAPLTLESGDIPLTRQQINQALANPQSLGVQVQASTGPQAGLVLTQVSGDGLVARLGLQTGDTLRLVNGNPVANVQDLARLLSSNGGVQRVILVGERQGKPLFLSYRLQQER